MEDNETEWFLAQFISLYVGNGVQTTLELDKTKFTYTGLPRTDIQKMLCRLAEHSVYCSHTAKAYSNT